MSMIRFAALAVAGLSALPASAQTAAPSVAAAPAAAAPADYNDGANWLCRPGRKDSCGADLTSTIVTGDGKLTVARFAAAASPKVDCFYVYPTVSLDRTPNSDLVAGPEEHAVIAAQFARFGEVCRTFAPLYRQVTIPALRAGMTGKDMKPDREIGYADVLAAWRHYLATDNKGRGFVLIGHSQGSGVLKRLIAEQIDGKPDQARMIGAYLIGTNLLVPAGKTVGGDFKTIPICTKTGETGCAVSYVSFRDTIPPPATSRFARTDRAGMQVACVNPAALGSDGPVLVKSYFSNRTNVIAASAPPHPWAGAAVVTTPFVQTPGLVTAACTSADNARYLKITVNAVPADARTDEISGDVVSDGQIDRGWGLHVIDINLTMGNLLDVARAQSRTYLARR